MGKHYLPRADSELLTWSGAFAERIALSPTEYGLSAEIAAQYSSLQNDFALKLHAAVDPSTRGNATVLSKDLSRQQLVSLTRKVVRIVQGQIHLTDAERQALGINIPKQPSKIPAPTEAPLVRIRAVAGRRVSVKLLEKTTAKGKKPEGVRGASVFSYVGDSLPESIEDWKHEGMTTRTDFEFTFPPNIAPGSVFWITACWFNPRAQTGPLGTAVNGHVQFGGGVEHSFGEKRRAA